MEFTVREGKRTGRWQDVEDENVIEQVNGFPGEDDENRDEGLFIGWYDYGCEGGGHYLGTTLPPGRYKIVPVEPA